MSYRALLAALALALSAPAGACADHFALEFDGAVFGVLPLGKIRLDMAVGQGGYDVTAKLDSSGLFDLFERTDLLAAASGEIAEDGPRWRRYDLDHAYSRKRRVIAMRVEPDGSLRAAITPNYRLWGEPPASDAQKQESRDPLSSLVAMSLAVARTRSCEGAFATFDGRFRYDLVLQGGRMGRYDEGGYDGPVLKCRLQYRPIAGYEPKDGGRSGRIPQGEVWFALIEDAQIAPPVRMLAPLPVGRAGLSLARFRRFFVDILPPETERPEGAVAP